MLVAFITVAEATWKSRTSDCSGAGGPGSSW